MKISCNICGAYPRISHIITGFPKGPFRRMVTLKTWMICSRKVSHNSEISYLKNINKKSMKLERDKMNRYFKPWKRKSFRGHIGVHGT